MDLQLNTIILRKSFFDMHEFKFVPFLIHALRYHYVFGTQMKERENALDNEAYSLFQSSRGNEDISLIKRVSFFIGDALYRVYGVYWSTFWRSR